MAITYTRWSLAECFKGKLYFQCNKFNICLFASSTVVGFSGTNYKTQIRKFLHICLTVCEFVWVSYEFNTDYQDEKVEIAIPNLLKNSCATLYSNLPSYCWIMQSPCPLISTTFVYQRRNIFIDANINTVFLASIKLDLFCLKNKKKIQSKYRVS